MKIIGRLAEPLPGTTRTKTLFAWLPTKAGQSLIWLERYQVMEAFIVNNYLVIVGQEQVNIRRGEWMKVSSRTFK